MAETEPRSGFAVKSLPLMLTLVAGAICYGLFFNRGLGLSVIGYSIAPSERVLQGEVPYRDFLFNYTPGILWVNALLMKAFGPTLMATRVGLLVFKLCTLVVLFLTAKRLTNNWVALAPVALTLAWLGYGQVFNVYPDQYLIVFALGALICVLNYDQTSRFAWLFWCGIATGVVFLFKYNVGVLLLATGIVAVTIRELVVFRRVGNGVKALLFFLGAFGAVGLGFVSYLMLTGSLGAMISHFLHHAAEYSESRSVSLPSPTVLLPAALVLIPAIAIAYVVLVISRRAFEFYWWVIFLIGTASLFLAQQTKALNDTVLALVAYLPPVLFISTLAVMGSELIRNRRQLDQWWSRNGVLFVTALFALAVYLEVFPRADYYHLVRVLPPVFLLMVVLLYQKLPKLVQGLNRFGEQSSRVAWLLMTIPVVFLIAIGLNNTWAAEFDPGPRFKDNRELRIERGRNIFVEERQAELTEGLVRLIEANSAPDEYIFSFAQRGSALYFLANRRNPTKFLWWRSVGISGEEREGVMTMISNRRAKLIVVQDIAANKEIIDFIGNEYDHIGTVADIAVYGLKKPFESTQARVDQRW